ncbi:DUF4097 family beta strand repeat-containing protein [Dubosiella newyorkensis]|uniref:DUF4097 domain-containing protein n=2 Tax=Dubosiella newyorkensis TaxID=1862672 RepID=A0A1U7NK82_9FIRM|nr:DUF4097 family beta strand repeat-containing protein [Dubosiella newyorkensis]OLU44481.1 hypothetical protein BO225_10395 [Dubosiella newyorkensis]
MSNRYYEQLRNQLLAHHSPQEVEDMIAYLQEATEESGLAEEEYLASLGPIEEVVSYFEGEEAKTKEASLPPIPSQTNKSLYFETLKSVLISIPNGQIVLQTNDVAQIRCEKGQEFLNILQEEAKLIISAKPQSKISLFKKKYPEIILHVDLPHNLDLEWLEIHSVNAEMKVIDQQASSARFEVVNGNLFLENNNFDSTKISSVNGDIDIVANELGTLRFDTVNGDAKLQSCRIKEGKISSVNGKLILGIETNSSIRVNTVCGTIKTEINKQKDFIFSSIPGSQMRFPGTDPESILKISTVSGKIQFIE